MESTMQRGSSGSAAVMPIAGKANMTVVKNVRMLVASDVKQIDYKCNKNGLQFVVYVMFMG